MKMNKTHAKPSLIYRVLSALAFLFLAQHTLVAATGFIQPGEANRLFFQVNPDPPVYPHPGFPFWDMYAYWDTLSINPYKLELDALPDSMYVHILHMDCGFAMPLSVMSLTSKFGYRWGKQHKGIDFDLETGDTVYNMFDGIVRVSGYHSGYGHVVVVRHHNGLETLYGHLSRRLVKPGDMIYAGQLVGLGGNTGHSTGSHLHFETRFMGMPFNPEKILNLDSGELYDEFMMVNKELFELPAPPPSQYRKKAYSRRSYAYRRSRYRR